MDLSAYLMSIVGVVILGILIDLVLPEGKINKYTKSIMAIFVIGVILSPLTTLLKSPPNPDFSMQSSNYTLDQSLLDNLNRQNMLVISNNIESFLAENGYQNVDISITTENNDGEVKIKYIYVNLCDLVITKNLEHIDYTTKIKELVIKLVENINEEQIVLYG